MRPDGKAGGGTASFAELSRACRHRHGLPETDELFFEAPASQDLDAHCRLTWRRENDALVIDVKRVDASTPGAQPRGSALDAADALLGQFAEGNFEHRGLPQGPAVQHQGCAFRVLVDRTRPDLDALADAWLDSHA